MSTETFKSRLQCQTSNIVKSETSSWTTSVGKNTSRQPTWRHRVRKKHSSTWVLDCSIAKRIKKNQVEMYQMQTQERQPNPPIYGRPTPRTTRWTCVLICPYRCWLLRTHRRFLRRTLKRWCCLFTCLTTRAVHIEVAQSLYTESCLAAVTRFIARRGYPSTIISGKGTDFVGAANELKAFMYELDKAKIESVLAARIVCKFNPPGAPHFGRIWYCFKVARKSWLQSWTSEALPTKYWAQQCVL